MCLSDKALSPCIILPQEMIHYHLLVTGHVGKNYLPLVYTKCITLLCLGSHNCTLMITKLVCFLHLAYIYTSLLKLTTCYCTDHTTSTQLIPTCHVKSANWNYPLSVLYASHSHRYIGEHEIEQDMRGANAECV